MIRELGHNYSGGRVTYLATNTNQHSVVIKQFQFAKFNSDWSDFKAHEREIQVLQGSGLPLATIIFYPAWLRSRLIAKYRKSEQHLIEP